MFSSSHQHANAELCVFIVGLEFQATPKIQSVFVFASDMIVGWPLQLQHTAKTT